AEVTTDEGQDLAVAGVEPGLGRIGALRRRAVVHGAEDLGDRHGLCLALTPGGGGKRPSSGRWHGAPVGARCRPGGSRRRCGTGRATAIRVPALLSSAPASPWPGARWRCRRPA